MKNISGGGGKGARRCSKLPAGQKCNRTWCKNAGIQDSPTGQDSGEQVRGPRTELAGPSFLLLFVYCHARACHTMSFRSFINVNEMLLPALAHSSLQLRFYCSDLLCFLARMLELATICRRVNTTQSKVATRPSCFSSYSCPHISLMHS